MYYFEEKVYLKNKIMNLTNNLKEKRQNEKSLSIRYINAFVGYFKTVFSTLINDLTIVLLLPSHFFLKLLGNTQSRSPEVILQRVL